MEKDDLGDIYLVTMVTQIDKLDREFEHLKREFNPKGKLRYTPLPLKPIVEDHELSEGLKERLSAKNIKVYMSIVMSIGWIVGNIRPNLKFAHHVIAKKLAVPRVWDMYLAVWLFEHVVLTKNWPLVLGGKIVDPEVFADASFATMEELKSIGAHALISGPGSGVIFAQVSTYKVAVKSIFEAETMAASAGQDTMIYANHIMDELQYPSQNSKKVRVDNSGAIDWIMGSTPTKRSKHMEVRLYRSRHLVAEGQVEMDYVATKDNIADLLTKSLPRQPYERLACMMLGHLLVPEEFRFWMV